MGLDMTHQITKSNTRPFLDLCMSSLHMGHANLLYIFSILCKFGNIKVNGKCLPKSKMNTILD